MSNALEKLNILVESSCLHFAEDLAKPIETALKNYQELLEKPCVLMGRTNGQTQALIDAISKNYKAIKITTLDNPKELKALAIIKETPEFAWYVKIYENAYEMIADRKSFRLDESAEELQKKFDLLKEVLK